MLTAVVLCAAIATGISHCQNQNAMIVMDNGNEVTDVVAVEVEEEKVEEKIDLSKLECRKEWLEENKALFTNYKDSADNLYDQILKYGNKYQTISDYLEDVDKYIQQIEEALNNPDLTYEEYYELSRDAYSCYLSGATIKQMVGTALISQAVEQTK